MKFRLRAPTDPADPVSADAAAARGALELGPDREEHTMTPSRDGHAPDEVSIRGRSLLGVPYFLPQSVEPPAEHAAAGPFTVTRHPGGDRFDWRERLGDTTRIRSSKSKPDDAFAAVAHRDGWFYRADDDLTSTSTLSLLHFLFSLQSDSGKDRSPVLMLPVGLLPPVAPVRNDPMHTSPRRLNALRRLARLMSLAALLAGWGIAAAAPDEAFSPEIRRVLCNDVVCGSMEISWYRRFQDEDTTPTFERFGVNIRGRFRTFRDQPREFHFLQALTRFKADDFRWSRDPSVTLPPSFVDTPPFGLQRAEADAVGGFRTVLQKFDALPWYDEGDFPLFEDRPRAFLASARRHGSVTMEFETWVVCVIEARQGPDPDRVDDDRYEVAALLGWTWGYEIIHRDVGALGVDEFEDYTLSLLPLRFVTRPSAAFEAALGTTMGETVTDRFDIRLGVASKCGGGAR